MSGSGGKKQRLKPGGSAVKRARAGTTELGTELADREKRFEIFVIAVLFGFGIYHSILYFGHQVVPNPDFTAFVHTGRRILSFQLPSSYKRAPVLGMLQVILSCFVGGQHPDLTAGWLLNAILHPFIAVLLWLVGKRIVGRAALWIAIVAIINPWLIQAFTDPIAETTLLFFTLLTFYFIFRRSRWCYLFASITSMVRYEGAALILAAFVMDMMYCRNRKQRLMSLVYAAAASVPLGLWMLGTVLSWRSLGSTHYLKELGIFGDFGQSLMRYIVLIWETGFYHLFIPVPSWSETATGIVFGMSKLLVGGSFVFGVVYGLCKRRWDIVALLLFFVPYIMVHILHSFQYHRFCVIIFWIVLLICLYGLAGLWRLMNGSGRLPKPLIVMLQGVVLVLSVVWLARLVPHLSQAAPMSRRSASMPFVAMGVVVAIYVARRFVWRIRYLWRDLSVSVLVCLMIVSNQFVLIQIVGNGDEDIEFKRLADWYVANAGPGEKLVSTMSNILRIFAPAHKDSFVHMAGIKAENPSEFAKRCYEKEITYVTWDSRLGVYVLDRYYKYWGMKNIAMLSMAKSIGPYEFIAKIPGNDENFVNVFRLRAARQRSRGAAGPQRSGD